MKFIFSDTHTYRIKIKSLSKPQLDSANYILFAPMVNLFRGAELWWMFFSNHIRYYPGSSRVSNQSVLDKNHFSSRPTYTKLWSMELSGLITSHSTTASLILHVNFVQFVVVHVSLCCIRYYVYIFVFIYIWYDFQKMV